MRKMLFVVAVLSVVVLGGREVATAQENGTIPNKLWLPVVGNVGCPHEVVKPEYRFGEAETSPYEYDYFHLFVVSAPTYQGNLQDSSHGDLQVSTSAFEADIFLTAGMGLTRGQSDFLVGRFAEEALEKGMVYFARMRYICDNRTKTDWSQWIQFVAEGRDQRKERQEDG